MSHEVDKASLLLFRQSIFSYKHKTEEMPNQL